ncbi:MAG: fructosamine kinase family protein [Chloroflexi bacterium]|nr:fructosamine kinase family protein [Chloroflexota bacterium]
MTIPHAVRTFIRANNSGDIISTDSIGGGCINNGSRVVTSTGDTFFLKQNETSAEDMFLREYEGLMALHVENGPRVPEPLLHGNNFLLLEDLAPARRATGYWQSFAHQLAELHKNRKSRFGFDNNNYIGSTAQDNTWEDDGYLFFGQNRLGKQAELGLKKGYLSSQDMDRIERLIGKLNQLIPEQPASLLHGDLWTGNLIADSQGNPALIDPAVHFGWAEADLAMTDLFGGFSDEFYAAYTEANPLTSGWKERFPIYNLYHLLNHVNLFGLSYLGQVRTILNTFV